MNEGFTAAADATIPVFRSGGFYGTSLTDLGYAMRLAPGSIYKAFADKRAIFRNAFERYVSTRGETLRAAVGAASDGRAKLASFLRYYVASASGIEGRAGCLVVNAATELASTEPEMARRVSGVFESTETLLTGLLQAGQDDGSIRRDVDVPIQMPSPMPISRNTCASSSRTTASAPGSRSTAPRQPRRDRTANSAPGLD